MMHWQDGLKHCAGFLSEHGIAVESKRFLLAVSGGVDSMVMLTMFADMGIEIGAAHVNYGLRGDAADADTELVRNTCTRLGIKMHEKSINLREAAVTGEGSLQELGRDIRYTWFDELCISDRYDYICTGHHQDDSAETFFINLLRGTGVKGLAGIPVVRGRIVRPMLSLTRSEIEALAQERKIEYRDDASNFERDYLRNRIRHDLMPLLQAERSGFISRMNATQQRLSEEYALLEDYLARLKSDLSYHDRGILVIDRARLMKMTSPPIILHYVIRGYGFTLHQCRCMLAQQENTGSRFLSADHTLIIDRNRFYITPHKAEGQDEAFSISWPGKYILGDGELVLKKQASAKFSESPLSECVDASTLKPDLLIRHWRSGDFFYPLGGPGKQKLQDFFTNAKVPYVEKFQTWLLMSGDEIVWVVGMRLDDRFKITSETTEVIGLEWNPAV